MKERSTLYLPIRIFLPFFLRILPKKDQATQCSTFRTMDQRGWTEGGTSPSTQ